MSDFKTAKTLHDEQGAATALAVGLAGQKEQGDIELAVQAANNIVTPAQVRVLLATVGKVKRLSIEQVQLFLTICARKGVDPFTEAYVFPEGEGIAFGLRIDGMRALAMRTGQYLSRKVDSIVNEDGDVVGARCTVERKGLTAPIVEEAYFGEYRKAGIGWDKYPETMIRKVAESKALRAAFPDALSGVYEPSEME